MVERRETNRAPTDWTAHATDTIDQAVGLVRDRATVPVQTAARAIVYGIALVVVALTAVVLGVIALSRIMIAYLPVSVLGKAPNDQVRVWVSYLMLGGILTVAAVLVLRKAESSTREKS